MPSPVWTRTTRSLRKQIAELRSAAGRERSVARREQQIDANGELRARARDLLARIKPPE